MACAEYLPAKSYSCNVHLLVALRARKGWTQRELALASGYSQRLISKAESGRAISRSAIEILAEALSTDDLPVGLADLVCDTVPLAKEFLSALYVHQKHAIAAIRHLLDEQIVFRIAGDPTLLPFAGVHVGLDAVNKAWDNVFTVLEPRCDLDCAPSHSYFAQGNEVIVWGDLSLHPIGRPMEQPLPASRRISFRKGKIVLFEKIFDTVPIVSRIDLPTGDRQGGPDSPASDPKSPPDRNPSQVR